MRAYIYIYIYISRHVNLKKHGADMLGDQEEEMLLKKHDFSGNILNTIYTSNNVVIIIFVFCV